MVGYGVYASSDCRTWLAFGPLAAVDKTTTQVVAGAGLNLTFFLVAEVGVGGQIGPTGHYGNE
jgi:hypothetical protein